MRPSTALPLLRRLPLLLLTLLAIAPALAQSPDPSVIASRAEFRPWADPLEALGTLSASESVTLSATVTETIAALNFRDGERVESGQLLVQLQDDETQAQLRAAQALRDERRAVVNRLNQLQSRNLAARADVEDSQARLRQVEAEIEEIQARLSNRRLRAPFDGVVGFRDISIGALVTPGTPLVTLDKVDVMKLDFSVPEVHLASLVPGLRLTARSSAYLDTLFEGEVASVGARVDPVSRSVQVRAELQNPDLQLRPGMLLTVTLERLPRQALVVPESALMPVGERHYVMVLDEADDYRAERRRVFIGERRDGLVEIREGLADEALVVSHGTQQLRDGQRVALLGITDDQTSIREILERNRSADEQGEA